MQDLRFLIRLAKAFDVNIKYKDLAEIIQITPAAFYNYLKGYYELSYSKKKLLRNYLEKLIYIKQ